MTVLALRTASPEETLALGAALGRTAEPGDVIGLLGDLGAGKTLLTQGIGAGLGVPEAAIHSPTFTLVAEHFEGRIPLYHFDLYRLDGIQDLKTLSWDEYREGGGLCVVEWADRAAEVLPVDRLEIRIGFAPSAEERFIEVSAGGSRSRALAEALRGGWAP